MRISFMRWRPGSDGREPRERRKWLEINGVPSRVRFRMFIRNRLWIGLPPAFVAGFGVVLLLLVSGGCSKRKEPKPLITEAPAVETEIGGYITETESSTPESQSVSGTIRLPIQEPEHQNESSTESEVVSASIYIGSNGSFRAYPTHAQPKGLHAYRHAHAFPLPLCL